MIPKKVRVLNYEYKICERSDLNSSLECDGLCDPNARVIYLQKNLPKEMKTRVLMHELMHALQFEAGFCDILNHQTQEIFAETVAGFLCQILKVNFK